MAKHNWADFGSASINKQSDGHDDDWADFGGFEVASPAVNGSAQQSGSSSLISWAAFSSPPPALAPAASVNQETTGRTTSSPAPFPTFASAPSNPATDGAGESSISPADKANSHSEFITSFLSSDQDLPSQSMPGETASSSTEPATDTHDSGNKTEYDSFHADFASFLQDSLTSLSQESPSLFNEPDLLKRSSSLNDSQGKVDLSAGTDLETTATCIDEEETTLAVKHQPLEETPGHLDNLDNEVLSAQDILSVVMAQQPQSALFDKEEADNSHKELTLQLQDTEESNKRLEENLAEVKGELSIAEQEKQRLQQELELLLGKNKELKEESDNLTESLENQKDKYKKLQEKHQEQIVEIRKAGHDALAIIVEEYKELSRKAVLEQQEQNKLRMENALEEQRKTFQQFLHDQQESFERISQEEKENMNSLLAAEKQRHQAEIESYIEEERLKSKEALDRAVEDTRQQGLQALEEAMKAEKDKYDVFMTEQEEVAKTIVEQEGERLQEVVEKAILEEKKSSKVALEEALREERKRGKESAQQAVEETKNEMLEYLHGKQQADRAARLKHLHGLDLFLDSARTQLKTLMEEQGTTDPDEQ